MSKRKTTSKARLTLKKVNQKSGVIALSNLKKISKSAIKKANTLAPKIEPKAKKNKSNKLVQSVKPKLKKAEVVAFVKTPESKIAAANKPEVKKLKAVSTVNKTKTAEKKNNASKSVQTIKPKARIKQIAVVTTPKSKTRKLKPVASDKQIKPVREKKISSVSARDIKKKKPTKIELKVSEKPAKSKRNIKPINKVISVKKAKTVEKKIKQDAITQKTKTQAKNNKAAKTVQIAKPKTQKITLVKSAVKIEDKKSKIKSEKSSKTVSVKKIKPEKKQIKFPVLAKTIKLERNKVVKAKIQKNKPVIPIAKAQAIKIETVVLPVEKKLTKRKNKPISSAVFRGRKDRYDFKVFPLDNDFEDVSAIYVISRRKIDRQKKGHHALVCIGQTDSVLGELKRHKNKCIKKYNANVISILPEANEKKRIKIEEDLRAAHTIACNIV